MKCKDSVPPSDQGERQPDCACLEDMQEAVDISRARLERGFCTYVTFSACPSKAQEPCIHHLKEPSLWLGSHYGSLHLMMAAPLFTTPLAARPLRTLRTSQPPKQPLKSCLRRLPKVTTRAFWRWGQPTVAPIQEPPSFDQLLLESPLPVLVDFHTAWCGPCKLLSKVLDIVEPIVANEVKIIKIDTEKEEAVAGRYHITSLPTLMLFKGAEVVDRYEGYMGEIDLRLWLKKRL